MKLKLHYSSKTRPFDKYDLSKMLSLLDKLQAAGFSCEKIDTSNMTDEEIQHLYIEAIQPSVYNKYRIRQVFGSRRHSGWLFGKHVPALLVYDEEGRYPIDVYPHVKGGEEVTIEEFLTSLLEKKESQPQG